MSFILFVSSYLSFLFFLFCLLLWENLYLRIKFCGYVWCHRILNIFYFRHGFFFLYITTSALVVRASTWNLCWYCSRREPLLFRAKILIDTRSPQPRESRKVVGGKKRGISRMGWWMDRLMVFLEVDIKLQAN